MGNRTITADEAKASSAHSRINIPLNLENWRDVPERYQADLLWFHQHILDQAMTWTDVEEAVSYDRSSIFRFLKGTSEGSYANFVKAIRSYRRIVEQRGTIQAAEFAHNGITRIIWAALDYAIANGSMTLTVGDSGMGKSTAMLAWRDEHNSGRSVYVDCPPVGGIKGFLGAIAHAVGVNRNLPVPAMLDAVVRSFNRNRILLLDNMHRVLPSDGRSSPRAFDIVQHLFDNAHCAVGVTATARLDGQMRHASYMYEQFTGRLGTPIYLPHTVKDEHIRPIIAQYYPKPSAELMELAISIANGDGRIRQLVERLKLASRIAGKSKTRLAEAHFRKAVVIRDQLSKYNKHRRQS